MVLLAASPLLNLFLTRAGLFLLLTSCCLARFSALCPSAH